MSKKHVGIVLGSILNPDLLQPAAWRPWRSRGPKESVAGNLHCHTAGLGFTYVYNSEPLILKGARH